jgi:hypothetical protein
LHAPVGIDLELFGLYARLGRSFQRTHLLGVVAAHFPNEHARDPDTIGSYIPNLFAFADLSRTTVDGFIGVFVRCGASAPFEETDEITPDLEVAGSRSVAIRAQRVQQPIEGILRKRPLLTDGRGRGSGARIFRTA